MADGATIGALRFVLGADTAQLEAATGKASAAMRAAARAGEVAGNQIVAAFTRVGGMLAGAFAVDRIVQFAAQALQAGAAIRTFADQAGLTTTQFQELQFALRETGVSGEQMGAAFGAFSRNLADLKRGTGPLLDFLRQSAPQFIGQFQRVTDVNEAFTLLSGILSRARTTHDGLRLAQAAGGEQMARLAGEASRLGTSLDRARQQAHDAGHVLSETQIDQLRKARQAWTDFGDWVTIQSGRVVVAIQNIGTAPAPDVSRIVANIATLQGIVSRLTEGTALWRTRVAELRAEQEKLNQAIGAGLAISTQVTPTAGVDNWVAQQNAIKAAQDALALYMARLNQLPSQANFVSGAFQQAWAQMNAALAASGASEAARAAARIQLIQQEAAARTQALGNAMLLSETLARREEELRLRRDQGLITETEHQRALNLARSEYQLAQMQEMQGLGVTLSIQEQYQLSIDRTNNSLARGAITAEQAGRAHRAAALTASAAWLGAAGQIAGSLAQAFPKHKAFAVAAAVINVAEGITKSLALPFPLNWAQAAAVSAAGLAQINAIKSANPGGSGTVPSVAGGAAGGDAAGPQQAAQMLTVNLAPGRYSRDEVVGLMAQIQDALNDGAQLVIRQ